MYLENWSYTEGKQRCLFIFKVDSTGFSMFNIQHIFVLLCILNRILMVNILTFSSKVL